MEVDWESSKFITTPTKLRETIGRYGVGIIEGVLDDIELISMRDGMWDYLEHVTQKFELPINRRNNATWREYSKLYPKHSMLLQHWGVGHSQFIWDLRQNEKIVSIFSEIWQTPKEDLLTSFDGASFHFPPEVTRRGWFRGNLWYHTDQSYTRNDFECIQSWVTAYDVNKGDATLAFLEGSNKFHKDAATEFDIKDKNDWYLLNVGELEYYKDKGCKECHITCKAGSMVFWDSRTIHCGTEPTKSRESDNFRNVVYICMMPRSSATDGMIRKKRKAFDDLRMTSHWPNKSKLFPKYPRIYGPKDLLPTVVNVPKPNLTSLGLRLAGF